MSPKALNDLALKLFADRSSLMLLWQEIAEHFYVERADFTVKRTLGEDYAANLTTSYPLLCRRDLGDAIGQMLRPNDKAWFHMVPRDVRIEDNASKRWLEWAEGTQRRAMYDRITHFSKSMKQADHDFATFGQEVVSVLLNRQRTGLIYNTWHLRDVVWREDQDGTIDFKARKWPVSVVDLIALFPQGNIDPKIRERLSKDPFGMVNVMHIVCSSELVDGHDPKGKPRFSIYWDMDHSVPIEVVPVWGQIYLMPRWATPSGSQYAFSPASVLALPEGRLLQAMTLTLLEAGEKAANPPLIATKDAVKSDMQQFPGGVTWVDQEYDERLGEALRAMNIDTKGLPINLELVKDSRGVLMQCFYLNKLQPFSPATDPEMTAFQAGQYVQSWIRGAVPLFEPMEQEKNAAVCEETFDILYRNGAFGSPWEIPQPLRNADIDWRFESPLHDAIEQQKGLKFLEFSEIVAKAVALDPTCAHMPDAPTILRDVAGGIRAPAKWLRTELEFEQSVDAANEAKAEAATLEQLAQGAATAKDLGVARKDMAQAAAITP